MPGFYFQSIFLCTALLAFVIYVLSYTKKRNLPPSPPALPFIGHLHLFKKPLHQTLARISEQYGPITYLQFGSCPAIVISSRSLAEECFTTNDLALANRPQFSSIIRNDQAIVTMGEINYGPFWRDVRRISAVQLLSAQRLQASSDVRAREVENMTRQLFKSWKTSVGLDSREFEKLELKTSLFQLSLNVLMVMITGKRLYGDNLADLDETIRFREAVEEYFTLSGASNIEDFLAVLRFLDLNGVMKRKKHMAKQHKEMVVKLIEQHRNSAEPRKTMIAHLLELQEKDPEGYSDPKIECICLSILLAGTDTSSNTAEWAMPCLVNNPEVLKKAVAEIDEHVGNERLIEESDMTHLPYLECILREVLRLYPGGPLLVPHESCKDVKIGGYNIPGETMILVNVYRIHRDPNMWEEPSKFKPERFMNGRTDQNQIIPFGMGRRKCPGEGLAMREVGLFLGTLIQCFDWEQIGDELVDMTEGSGLTLPKAVPLEAMYRPRQNMMKVLSALSSSPLATSHSA